MKLTFTNSFCVVPKVYYQILTTAHIEQFDLVTSIPDGEVFDQIYDQVHEVINPNKFKKVIFK